MTDYYDPTGSPASNSAGDSATIRAEFAAIQSGISDKLPPLTGNAGEVVVVNAGATGLESTASPTLVAPLLGTPASGNLSGCTADGTNAIGFRHVPQNSQSADYTCVLADAGKHILHPSADTSARTFTIPANSTVAYPVGAAITFVNQDSGGDITIAITTDTMRLAGTGATGSRTLTENGIATALKVTTTEWLISGTGIA